ncbi:MAG: P-loop NTPase [Clostridiales bacterium]|jgi:MinD-like ATPase involved in chromosome partitioning or flagellar assembly|nr:P-loop NTPase [Clostridiales bacterium]
MLISVWGKNGAGKSTISANLACWLAIKGSRTALVGANRFYGAIQHYFGLDLGPEQSLRNVLSEKDSMDIRRCFVEYGQLKALSVASLSNEDDVIGRQRMRPETAARFLELTDRSFERTIIDCDESTDDALSMLSLVMSDKVLYVTKPGVQFAVFARACESLVGGLRIEDKLRVVCNADKRRQELSDCGAFNVKKDIFALPYCRDVESSGDAGKPFMLARGAGRRGSRYRRALGEIGLWLEKPGADGQA